MLVPHVTDEESSFPCGEILAKENLIPNAAALKRFDPRAQVQLQLALNGAGLGLGTPGLRNSAPSKSRCGNNGHKDSTRSKKYSHERCSPGRNKKQDFPIPEDGFTRVW
jgi:hypothetical protein